MGGPPGGPPGGPQEAPSTNVVPAAGSEGAAAAVPAVGSMAVAPAVASAPKTGNEEGATRKEQSKRPKRHEGEPSELVAVADVRQLVRRGDIFMVHAGAIAGLRKNMVLRVVGPEQEGGKRRVLGYVTVDEVKPMRTKLLPDPAVLASKDVNRFVALPEAEEGASPIPDGPPAPAPAPATPPPPRKLALGVKETSALGLGVVGKGFTINSLEDHPLNNCKATIERALQHRFARLVRGENKVDHSAFQPVSGVTPVRRGWMRIECDEGSQEIQIR
jgi:eukaryotic-like serine/threonine-protein kinase